MKMARFKIELKHRKILIFFVATIFFLLNFNHLNQAIAADINLSIQPGASASGSNGNLGAPSDIKDDNTGTYYGFRAQCPHIGPCSLATTLYAEVTLVQAYVLNKVEVHHSYGANEIGFGGGSFGHWYLELYYGGAWHTAADGTWDSSMAGGITTTDSDSTGWPGVTKIRMRVDLGGVGGFWNLDYYVNELRAWGSPSSSDIDIGLRVYDGTEIISIACEPAGTLTSPLRIHKNGITYGVVLVDPTDPNASKIRINTNSGIKALRKL